MDDSRNGVRLVKVHDDREVVLVNPEYIVKVDIKPSREPGNDFFEVHLKGFVKPLVLRKNEFDALTRNGAVWIDE